MMNSHVVVLVVVTHCISKNATWNFITQGGSRVWTYVQKHFQAMWEFPSENNPVSEYHGRISSSMLVYSFTTSAGQVRRELPSGWKMKHLQEPETSAAASESVCHCQLFWVWSWTLYSWEEDAVPPPLNPGQSVTLHSVFAGQRSSSASDWSMEELANLANHKIKLPLLWEVVNSFLEVLNYGLQCFVCCCNWDFWNLFHSLFSLNLPRPQHWPIRHSHCGGKLQKAFCR